MMDRTASLLTVTVGLCLAAATLVGLEIVLRAFWDDGPACTVAYDKGAFHIDAHGIFKARPGRSYRATARDRRTGARIYDVLYEIDGASRRRIPATDPSSRAKHLLLFGCSFMYGEGLRVDKTVPYLLGAAAVTHRPYNYAFHGHSPAELLAKMESGELPLEVPEKRGALIYLFMDDHVSRVIGSMRQHASRGGRRPYYFR